MSYDEQGVRAIIELQKLAGIKEPREKAKRGWLAMDPFDREQTMLAYERLVGR